MQLRTLKVFFTIFGQCINVLNYNSKYETLTVHKIGAILNMPATWT